MPGIILEGNTVVGFKNTDDFQAVTKGSYARFNILNNISDSDDLERVKELFFGERTWIIQCIHNEDLNTFEAHTAGMENYSHLDFKIKDNIGEEEISYLLNSLCKSIQRGNAFKDGDRIENLYENYDVILKKTRDDYLEVTLQKSL